MGADGLSALGDHTTLPIYLVSSEKSLREKFEDKLNTLPQTEIRTLSPEAASEMDEMTPGVTCLLSSSPEDPELRDKTTASHSDEEDSWSTEGMLAAVNAPDREFPVIVIGPDNAATTAYQAGASDIIPVDLDKQEVAVDRIESIVKRSLAAEIETVKPNKQLLLTTQELMSAESVEEVAQITSEATTSILGQDLNVVYLYGNQSDHGHLTSVSWSNQLADLLDQPPDPTETGPISEAFRRGEPILNNDLENMPDSLPAQYGEIDSLLAVPLESHGVLLIASTTTDSFDEVDIERTRSLTLSATAALERIHQRRDLEQFETVFDTVQDKIYVTNEQGKIQLVNDALAEYVGTEADTLQDQHLSSFVTEETAKEAERLVLDMLVTPDTVSSTYEGQIAASDGDKKPVEIELSLLPFEDTFRGTVGAVRDISKRRQREQELYVFREAITRAGIGLAMYGPDGRFEYVNDHYVELLNYSREELESSRVWTVFDTLTPIGFDDYWEKFDAGETETATSKHRRADGTTIPVETVTTAVEIEGDRHHISTIQDITDRQERRQQAEALHRILRHNLRNDLTVMNGHVNKLAAELPSEYQDSIDTLVDTTEGLIELAETAAEARDLFESETRRNPVEITDLLQEEVERFRGLADAEFNVKLPEAQYVLADSSLQTAVNHLLRNAVEYNDSKDPQIWVRVTEANDRENWITIEISDNGPGIPDIEQETLKSGAENQLRHGIGLGLWIVQWIVSRYGGDLTFESCKPRGTCVRIALPAAERWSPDSGAGEI